VRIFGVSVLAIVALLAGLGLQAAEGDGKEEAVAKDLQAIKGTWRLICREVDGRKDSEEEIKDTIGTGDGLGKFSVRQGDKLIGEGTVKLDPTKKPKTMDVAYSEGRHKGERRLGIYEIEGDTFRICVAKPGDERPTDFSANTGSGRILIVYQREKK
jgi:uncharacterized protein (TIGR03067 family)